MLYIDKSTGTIGNSDDLVLVGNDAVDPEEDYSDSDITGIAHQRLEDNSGIDIGTVHAFLVEVQEQRGDWRGTLDYLVSMLADQAGEGILLIEPEDHDLGYGYLDGARE